MPFSTAAAVNATLAKLTKRFPDGLKTTVVYDTTTFVKDTIGEVIRTLVEAFILVVLVVFLFLGSLRATIIPAVAVPVSLIGTFAVLLSIGYSANTVSLLALVLAIGIVVDDAIVRRRERRTRDGGGARSSREGRDEEGDERDHRADRRHLPRPLVRLRADRPSFPASPANCSASSR